MSLYSLSQFLYTSNYHSHVKAPTRYPTGHHTGEHHSGMDLQHLWKKLHDQLNFIDVQIPNSLFAVTKLQKERDQTTFSSAHVLLNLLKR